MNDLVTHPLTRAALKRAAQLQKKKYRGLEESFLAEGLLPLEEAARSSYVVTEIYYNPFLIDKPGVRDLLTGFQERDKAVCCEVTGAELKQISTEVTPQGIVAVVKKKIFGINDLNGNLLVLDRLQDPGNVGTLFRIAHWFGLGGVILMKGTVDVYNPKVVRSSMGSLFHLPFVSVDTLPETLLNGHTLLLSKAHEGKGIGGIRLNEVEPFLLVIGNEARGIDTAFDHLDHLDLTLPPFGGAESLNAAIAAAAILSKLLY